MRACTPTLPEPGKPTPSRLARAALAMLFAFAFAGPARTEPTPEEARLSALVLDRVLAGQARVQRIADPMRISGAPLCGERLDPVLGLFAIDERSFADFYRWFYRGRDYIDPLIETANLRFGLGRNPKVLVVVPGLAADRAGLAVGDVITAVDGHKVKRHLRLDRWANHNPESKRLELTIERNGVSQNVPIDVEWGCAIPARYHLNAQWNAFAASFGDLTGIYINEGLLRAHPSDDEVAVVIGHEFAHLALSNGSSKRTEAEADYLGLYFVARAGFDFSRAPGVWEERIRENPYATINRGYSSHPESIDRAAELFATMQEIREKKSRGETLDPEKTQWALNRPGVDTASVDRRRSALAGEAIERFRGDQHRVAEVSYRLAIASAPVCAQQSAPLLGAIVGRRQDFSFSDAQQTQAAFGVTDGVSVFAVAEGSPADRAGLRPGDHIIRVDGKKIKRSQEVFERLRDSNSGNPVLTIRRSESESALSLPRELGCPFGVFLFPSDSIDLDRHRNNKEMLVRSGTLRFARDDDELAIDIAHQMGHHVLGSFRTAKDEPRADQLGLRMAQLSGFDISKASAYWERKASVQFWQIAEDTGGKYVTHEGLARRLPVIQKAVAELLRAPAHERK